MEGVAKVHKEFTLKTFNQIFFWVTFLLIYVWYILPYLVSHKSTELPLLGGASVIILVYYWLRKLVEYLKRGGH
jgi:hypothetical protein